MGDALHLQAPFIMIDANFDGQNDQFLRLTDDSRPRLTGLIHSSMPT